MITSPRWSRPLLFAAFLIFNGVQPVTAQQLTSPVIQGFLGSQNSREFFKKGRIQLEHEVQRLEDFDRISLEQLLQLNPDAPIQDEQIQDLESAGQPERKPDRTFH